MTCEILREHVKCLLQSQTLDAGNDTGSNAKFSIRLACNLDFCIFADNSRSSFSISGGTLPLVSFSSGSNSSLWSLKRTPSVGGITGFGDFGLMLENKVLLR